MKPFEVDARVTRRQPQLRGTSASLPLVPNSLNPNPISDESHSFFLLQSGLVQALGNWCASLHRGASSYNVATPRGQCDGSSSLVPRALTPWSI
jgi:hypothetical protein